MRRPIWTLSLLLTLASAPLTAQTAFSFGYSGTLGNHWQVEALEAGLVRRVGLGPIQYGSVALRIGWFGDQGAIISGTRGFLSALGLAVRSGRLSLAQIGDDPNPTVIGVDLTLEAAGYLAARSPLPEGKRWASASLLAGVRVGQPDRMQFAILVGPAWFAGDVTRTRAFLSARVDVPLRRPRSDSPDGGP